MFEKSHWDFFIAHASSDRDTAIAEELYKLLAPQAKVFLDTECLELGENWDEALALAQKSSLITVVLVSSDTTAAYFQREEIIVALELSKDSHSHRVVPVYLDSGMKPADIPYGLRRKHGMILTGDITPKRISARLLRTLDYHRTVLLGRIPDDVIIVEEADSSLRRYGDDIALSRRESNSGRSQGYTLARLLRAFTSDDPINGIMKFGDRAWAIASFVLTIVGLSGLANGIVEWREFFDYGLIKHYLELRSWAMGYLPFRLPSWVGDYVTLGLAISYPVKGIVHEAKKNIPTLEVRLKIAKRFIEKDQLKIQKADALRHEETENIQTLERAFGSGSELSQKEKLRYEREIGSRRAVVRDQTNKLADYKHIQDEATSLEGRIFALNSLIQLLTYIRYVMIVLWPVGLLMIALFATGIIRGFDRSIIYSFLSRLLRVAIAFVLVVFAAVDLKKTFHL